MSVISNGMNTFDRIYKVVSKIPMGKVSTYGEVAKMADVSNPRVVGYALHSNKTPETIPCHRVVYKTGELSKGYVFGGLTVQKQLLEQEGVKFTGSSVNLNKYLYSFI